MWTWLSLRLRSKALEEVKYWFRTRWRDCVLYKECGLNFGPPITLHPIILPAARLRAEAFKPGMQALLSASYLPGLTASFASLLYVIFSESDLSTQLTSGVCISFHRSSQSPRAVPLIPSTYKTLPFLSRGPPWAERRGRGEGCQGKATRAERTQMEMLSIIIYWGVTYNHRDTNRIKRQRHLIQNCTFLSHDWNRLP